MGREPWRAERAAIATEQRERLTARGVTLVVPTFDEEDGIEGVVHRLSSLELGVPLEIIVVDDGSTDDTPQILARFPKVRAIRQENQGLSVARNVGAQAATGQIVAYTDSDCFAEHVYSSGGSLAVDITAKPREHVDEVFVAPIDVVGVSDAGLAFCGQRGHAGVLLQNRR